MTVDTAISRGGGGDGAGRDRAIAAEPFQDNPCHVFRGGVIAKVGPVSVEEIPRTDDAFTKGGNGHLQESVAHWTAALPHRDRPDHGHESLNSASFSNPADRDALRPRALDQPTIQRLHDHARDSESGVRLGVGVCSERRITVFDDPAPERIVGIQERRGDRVVPLHERRVTGAPTSLDEFDKVLGPGEVLLIAIPRAHTHGHHAGGVRGVRSLYQADAKPIRVEG
ncbi:MAG: hypothetical protein IPK69_03455 [Phycisphaerales bacterium]|nr:MAG: hypothetical protein IPK69_03455 [Phycisphaerales bacterium]